MTASAPLLTLEATFVRDLEGLYRPWQAAPAPAPRLLALNEGLAAELGLDPARLSAPEGIGFLVGTDLPDSAVPVAQAYAGHQFGGFNPSLGDGRALLLGEVIDADGRRRDIHLKGSGPTPFSRGGDGLAAVGPMLREYLIAEAMQALGIPTTRALAVVATGGKVARETTEPGAVLVRVAASHLRVGTFEYAAKPGRPRPRPAPGRPCHRPPPARGRRCAEPLPGVLRGRRRAAGRVDRPVDARGLHPRRDEHRQHDDLRGDDRLRPVCVHGRLRPGDGVQLHRPRRPLRLREPARDRPVEPGPLRRDPPPAAGRHRGRRGGRRHRGAPLVPRPLRPPPGRRLPSQARPGRRRRGRRGPDRGPARDAPRPAGRLPVLLPGPVLGAPR